MCVCHVYEKVQLDYVCILKVMSKDLSAVVSRLEAVTTRLEGLASRGGAGGAPEGIGDLYCMCACVTV